MSYHAEEAMIDLLAASGPQFFDRLQMEVTVQCAPVPRDLKQTALHALLSLSCAGLIEAEFEADRDDWAWDLTAYGWDVLTRLSQRPKRSGSMIIVATVNIDGIPLCIELSGDNCFIWYAGALTPTEMTIDAAIEKHAAIESQLIAQGIIKRT